MMNRAGVRQTLTVWLAIYPLLTVILWMLGDLLAGLPLPVRTLILTAGIVPLMVYVFIPLAKTIIDRLFPLERSSG